MDNIVYEPMPCHVYTIHVLSNLKWIDRFELGPFMSRALIRQDPFVTSIAWAVPDTISFLP